MNCRARRLAARLLICAALCTAPLALAACGSGSRIVGGALAHRALNHLFPGHQKTIDKAFCVLNVRNAFHDFTSGHKIYGAITAAAAVRNCERGFSKN